MRCVEHEEPGSNGSHDDGYEVVQMELTGLVLVAVGVVLGFVQPAYDFLSDDADDRRNARYVTGLLMLIGAAASTAVFAYVGQLAGLICMVCVWLLGMGGLWLFRRTELPPGQAREEKKFKLINFLAALLAVVGGVGGVYFYVHDHHSGNKSGASTELRSLRSDTSAID